MWRIFPLDIFSAHLSCGEISPRDRFSPPFSCGEIFHLTDLSPHFSCGEISPCDRVSPHLSCGETCHGENFSTWPIFSPQTPSVVSVTNIRCGQDMECMKPCNRETKKAVNISLYKDGVHGEINYETTKPQNLSASCCPEMEWTKPWNLSKFHC